MGLVKDDYHLDDGLAVLVDKDVLSGLLLAEGDVVGLVEGNAELFVLGEVHVLGHLEGGASDAKEKKWREPGAKSLAEYAGLRVGR